MISFRDEKSAFRGALATPDRKIEFPLKICRLSFRVGETKLQKTRLGSEDRQPAPLIQLILCDPSLVLFWIHSPEISGSDVTEEKELVHLSFLRKLCNSRSG